MEETCSLLLPLYDISQKVKEANEALRNEHIQCSKNKECRVKFCQNLIQYGPDNYSGDESNNLTGNSNYEDFIQLDQNLVVSTQYSDSEDLQKDEINMLNQSRSYTNDSVSGYHEIHSTISNHVEEKGRETEKGCSNEEDKEVSSNNWKEKYQSNVESATEISLADFDKLIRDMECDKTDAKNMNKRVSCTSTQEGEHTDKPYSHCLEKSYEKSQNEVERSKTECNSHYFNQECSMDTISSPTEQTKAEMIHKQKNDSVINSPTFPIKKNISAKLELSLSSFLSQHNAVSNGFKSSRHECTVHYKWNSTRLPNYNGLNSEYGLTAEMLDERKRKAEMIRQNLFEKKKQEEERKEQRRKANDESFQAWVTEKERRKLEAQEIKPTTTYVYNREEGEKAFKIWMKRKSKQLRLQRLENVEREYDRQEALRRAQKESQHVFKRWLQTKGKTPRKPDNHFSRRKPSKKYSVEKYIQMRNTSRIYAGH